MRYIDTGSAMGKVSALLARYKGKLINEPTSFKNFNDEHPGFALIIVENFERFERAAFVHTKSDWDYCQKATEFMVRKELKNSVVYEYQMKNRDFVMIPRAIALEESGFNQDVMKLAMDKRGMGWVNEVV